MKLRNISIALAATLIAPGAFAAPADIGTIVDESGSMAGEQAWLPDMIAALEAGLVAAGVGDGADANQYGTVGYGSSNFQHQGRPGSVQGGHKHLDATTGEEWQAAGDYGDTDPGFVTQGGYEDGYEAIDFFLSEYTFRPDAATNIILVTDEDRDFDLGTSGNYSYASTLAAMQGAGALLNAVVDANLRCSTGAVALGIDALGNCYIADGAGGFTTIEGGAFAAGGAGNTVADYVDLAIATGGAAWDLNQLRAGGLTADSFTNAFIAIKVREITEQNEPDPERGVPEPGTLGLLGLGLMGIAANRRRKLI